MHQRSALATVAALESALRCAKRGAEETTFLPTTQFQSIQRGAFFPEEIEQLSRIGEWKALWEKRLDQLEKFWQSQVMNHPTDVFDQLFIESFPYYLGVAENAIQYVVDRNVVAPQIHSKYFNKPRKTLM